MERPKINEREAVDCPLKKTNISSLLSISGLKMNFEVGKKLTLTDLILLLDDVVPGPILQTTFYPI